VDVRSRSLGDKHCCAKEKRKQAKGEKNAKKMGPATDPCALGARNHSPIHPRTAPAQRWSTPIEPGVTHCPGP